ncbi:hypothetical protein TI04_09300 [Achromatium sp. WMS2]|nr:hypothetical protein TI04_09300 [Achromatium sp. WMS2]
MVRQDYMKKLVIVLVVSVFTATLVGCANMETRAKRRAGIKQGLAVGSAAGYAACDGKPRCVIAGAIVGAVIGGFIARHLTAQDQSNIAHMLDNTRSVAPMAWCSGSNAMSHDVRGLQCGNTNKVIASPGPMIMQPSGMQCRTTKTEVLLANGTIENADQVICKGEDGKWHEQVADDQTA